MPAMFMMTPHSSGLPKQLASHGDARPIRCDPMSELSGKAGTSLAVHPHHLCRRNVKLVIGCCQTRTIVRCSRRTTAKVIAAGMPPRNCGKLASSGLSSKGKVVDVGAWLRSLGMERYEATFRENAVDGHVLPRLTADDLRDLGVSSVGHRRLLLDAVARLDQ
jgi:hypothetical protein